MRLGKLITTVYWYTQYHYSWNTFYLVPETVSPAIDAYDIVCVEDSNLINTFAG